MLNVSPDVAWSFGEGVGDARNRVKEMMRTLMSIFILISFFTPIAAIADGPTAPPPAPTGAYDQGSPDSITWFSFPNPLYGSACVETDMLDITRLSVVIPSLPMGKAAPNNAPDSGPPIVYVVPIGQAALAATFLPRFDNCWGAPKSPAAVTVAFLFASGTYSTDGTAALVFKTYTDTQPYILNASFAGKLTNWSRSGTVTFARTDPRDPNLSWKITASAVFNMGPKAKAPKVVKTPPPQKHPIEVHVVERQE